MKDWFGVGCPRWLMIAITDRIFNINCIFFKNAAHSSDGAVTSYDEIRMWCSCSDAIKRNKFSAQYHGQHGSASLYGPCH